MNDHYHGNEEIFTEELRLERKVFYFDGKSNENGRFIKITEKKGKMRNTIMISEEDLDVFRDKLIEVAGKFND